MTSALPNPFEFTRQIDLDLLCLQTVAGALQLEIEASPEPEAIPVFLGDPSPAYLTAIDIMPICAIITSHAARASL